jgi:hypothetical protein
VSHVATQRAVVRMLFDPLFADEARRDPERVLGHLPQALRAQLVAIDPRAFRLDRLRRRRALRTLADEWKATTTLVLQETRSFAFLETFFTSSAFHRAVEERGSMPLAFAEFLAHCVAEGRLTTPILPEVLALETVLAQARRAVAADANADTAGDERAQPTGDRLALAPGVLAIEVAAGALAALQTCEKYLFEVGLMPAVALCDDAPRLELDARAADASRLHLVTVPSGSGAVSLVTVDEELHRVLRAFNGPGARTIRQLVLEAAARGVPELRSTEILRGLVDDEIAVRA